MTGYLLATLDRFATRFKMLETSETGEILSLNVAICSKSIKRGSFL